MSDRDRIKSALARMVDEAPEPRPYGRVVGSERRERRRLAWPAWAFAAFGTVLVGVGVVVVLRPGVSTTVPVAAPTTTPAVVATTAPPATTSTTAPATTTTMPVTATTPSFTWQRVTDLPETDPAHSYVNPPIVTDNGFLTIEEDLAFEGNTARIWTSPDGITWQATPDDSFNGLIINDLADTTFGILAAGTQGPDNPTVWRSDDGSTWDTIDLPMPPPPAIESYQKTWSGINQIIAGPNGVMVLGLQGTSTDWNKLIEPFLPDGITFANTELSSENNTSSIRVYSEPDHTLLATVQVSDFGIDASKLDAMAADQLIWYSPDGKDFTLLEGAPETRTGGFLDMLMGAATNNGFVVFYQSSVAQVWTTLDGSSWDETPTSGLPASSFFNGIASWDGRIVVIGGGSSGQVIYYSDDGVSWKRADAPTVFSSSTVDSISVGPAGWFVSGHSSSTKPSNVSNNEWAPPPALWRSTDGTTWTSVGLPDDVFGLSRIPAFGAPAVDTDRIVIVGTEETNFGDGPVTGATTVIYVGTVR